MTLGNIKIAIDRGGTFTDVWASIPGKQDIIFKLLSVDLHNYDDAPTEGIRRVLEIATQQTIPKGEKLDGSLIEWIRMGTTVATNALLERKGDQFAYVTTKNFKDVLEIGSQARPELFNLNIKKPEVLYDSVIEIDERITVESYSDDPDPSPIDVSLDSQLRSTPSGTVIRILKSLDRKDAEKKLVEAYKAGARNLAVCFLHSYLYPLHEEIIREIALDIGYTFVSISSQVSPSIKALSRGNSTAVDAYLTPHIQRYVEGFLSSFSTKPRVEFMQSDGGLTSAKQFSGLKAILSGPAGGVVGFSHTSFDGKPVIGFDMGGTSTDVCRFGGKLDINYENITAGIDIVSPQLNIHTVAAGGGSILTWRNGLYHVGPESAGANPGPACYRKGGPLTVTDANLFVGRLIPEQFPAIFGPDSNEPLDEEITKRKFTELTNEINKDTNLEYTPYDVALGFLKVANETMARSIRAISEARGYATNSHNLSSFGGAGGQHACSISRSLGIKRIIIHKYSSILSAYGMALASVSSELKEPYSKPYSVESLKEVSERSERMKSQVFNTLDIASSSSVEFSISLGLRYKGTDTTLFVGATDSEDYESSFLAAYKQEFSFTIPEREIIIDAIRVRAVVTALSSEKVDIVGELQSITRTTPKSLKSKITYFDSGPLETTSYLLGDLSAGDVIEGPALIIDETQTILVEPYSSATILKDHVVIDLQEETSKSSPAEIASKDIICDPVLLSVFGHRFMSIAEQMGNTLQRTSVSVSIKERLDFSCAIFGPDGGLVANAPHIPVHLGSMQYAIQYQHDLWKGKLKPGDVLLSNHPESGGTHLPDLTVITPVFHDGNVVFYVASRGHHQDIGGVGITAMMPNSKELWQEGLSVKSFKLVSNGVFDEKGIVEKFMECAKYPGSSATRRIKDNLSDLRAQVSANQRGIQLVQALFQEYGTKVVQFYMSAIRQNAETAVREFFQAKSRETGGKVLRAKDYFDDGTPVEVKVTIDGEKGGAVFDFEGTGPQVYGCMNTPESITYSCVIYILRSLISLNIPLNQGCLTPCEIRIPKGTILNPYGNVAICGSTISAQRITDVLLKAFDVCAASQGCANSFGWGTGGKDPLTGAVTKGFTYGEALGGGVGAGPGWNGASASNVHATNTRTTDVEVIETRTPVIVRQWSIRRGSGGQGKYRGGDGAIREIEARIPLRVSILSERRVFSPYGLKGGKDGSKGQNSWYRLQNDGSYELIRLAGKEIININAGDKVVIMTPGGGGYGQQE